LMLVFGLVAIAIGFSGGKVEANARSKPEPTAVIQKVSKMNDGSINVCDDPWMEKTFGARVSEAKCVCMKESSGRKAVVGTVAFNETSVGGFQLNIEPGSMKDVMIVDAGLPGAQGLKDIYEKNGVKSCWETLAQGLSGAWAECVSVLSKPKVNFSAAKYLLDASGGKWSEHWPTAAEMCNLP